MEFQFKCPQCGVELVADESMRGEVMACPSCEKGIVVPQNRLQSGRLRLMRSSRQGSVPLVEDIRESRQPETGTPIFSKGHTFQDLLEEVRREKNVDRTMFVVRLARNLGILLILLGFGWGTWSFVKRDSGISEGNVPLNVGEATPYQRPSKVEVTPSPKSNPQNQDLVVEKVPVPKKNVDFDSCADKIVVIGNNGMQSGGSGFIATMSGKRYLVTNEHVARGPKEWFEKIVLINGHELKLGKFEVAGDQDVVRFELDEDLPAFEVSNVMPRMGENIFIYGNSSGGGAATSLSGMLKAVGPYRLEVDVEAVAGNSGSPVLNEKGEVIGIFSYITNERDDSDWGLANTQFNAVRRWAVRFSSLNWQVVDWKQYREQKDKLEDIVAFFRRVLPFLALANGVYDHLKYPYPLHYDEQTKELFVCSDEKFQPQLVQLSTLADQLVGKKDDSGRKRLRDLLQTKLALCEKVRGSLEDVKNSLTSTRWAVPRFQTNMTAFRPMKDYVDFLTTTLNEINRLVTAVKNEKIHSTDMNAIYEEVKNCIGLVRAGDSMGSGFIAKMNGKKYFFTNEHVVRGGNPLVVKTPSGWRLQFKSFEVAQNDDLVRMELVDDKAEALEIKRDDPVVNSKIFLFGNSDGQSVATHEKGQVMAVGPESLEVGVNGVQGNSGSAILDENGEVVGVFTYAVKYNEPENWVKKGSRYNEARKFGVRFYSGVKWHKMAWPNYARNARALDECDRYVKLCREICFRGHKLLESYEVKEMIQDGKLTEQELQQALLRVGKTDDELVALKELYEQLKQKMANTKKGSIDNPYSRLVRVCQNWPKARTKCFQARLSVLKAGLFFVDGIKWEAQRLSDDAIEYRRFFDFHIRRFKVFFREELLGPNHLTKPEGDRHRL